jgi:hypothetical protein
MIIHDNQPVAIGQALERALFYFIFCHSSILAQIES